MLLMYIEHYFNIRTNFQILISMLAVSTTPALILLAARFEFHGLQVDIALGFVIFFAGVFGLGVDSGRTDRSEDYKKFMSSSMRCDRMLILRPIGDKFIATDYKNGRHLIDDECN